MKTTGALIRSHWVALVILAAALSTHFWLVILHPGSVLYGGPGDHTASLIWLYEKSPGNPWWGQTYASAFPFGENLWSPTYVLGQLLYIAFWLCSAPFGNGVIGYNLLTTIGFIVSFLSFYVITHNLWKVKKTFAAAGGYIVAFTPFVLSLNTVGHLSYIFAPAASMVVIWLFATLFTKSKRVSWRWRATGLGLFVGLSWLFDPYFLLFLTLLVVSLVAGWLVILGYRGIERKDLWQRFGLASAVFFCSVAPLAIYSISQRQAISDNTSYRASIESDAQQYSAHPEDYVLPSAQNPVLPDPFILLKETSIHGASATPLYISLVLLFMLVVLIVLRLVKRKKIEPIIIVCLVATGVMMVFSLPPKMHMGNLEIIGPTYFIIQISSAWRVFSRIFIFFYPLVCIATFILLQSVWKEAGRYARYGLAIGLCLIPLDMLMRNPFDASLFWDIHKDTPSTYAEAHIGRNDTIAEYPLREAPHYKGSLYFSAQLSHDAAIVNPMMPDVTKGKEGIRRALADLHNPQTIGALKFLGVNKIQVWTSEDYSFVAPAGLTRLAADDYKGLFGKQRVTMYAIDGQVRPVRYIIEYEEVSRLWDDRIGNIHDKIISKATLRTIDLCDSFRATICAKKEIEKKDIMISLRLINESQKEATVRVVNSNGSVSDEYVIMPKTEQVVQSKGAVAKIVSSGGGIAIAGYHMQVNGD